MTKDKVYMNEEEHQYFPDWYVEDRPRLKARTVRKASEEILEMMSY